MPHVARISVLSFLTSAAGTGETHESGWACEGERAGEAVRRGSFTMRVRLFALEARGGGCSGRGGDCGNVADGGDDRLLEALIARRAGGGTGAGAGRGARNGSHAVAAGEEVRGRAVGCRECSSPRGCEWRGRVWSRAFR